MRKVFFLTFVAILFCTIKAYSQVYPKDTILKNGDISKLINIVVLPDGYTSAQQTTFITDANTVINYFFTQSPYSCYKNYFNVIAIKVPSNASGAKHPKTAPDCNTDPTNPVTTPDNYFGSSFDQYSIHRLLVPTNYSAISNVLSSNFPSYDIVLIIVNSPYYGGSGGSYATSSMNTNSKEVAIHEIGHSFPSLIDEYWAGSSYAHEGPNMTQQSDTSLVKWKKWLNYNGVGIYAFSEDPTWFRPHQNCKMRYLNVPFCNVCQETTIEEIHSLTNPIYSYIPTTTTFNADTGEIKFKLQLLKPNPNTLKITWQRNTKNIGKNIDSVIVDTDSLQNGANQLTASVLDTTYLTRSSTHPAIHLFTVQWTINKSSTSVIDIQSTVYETEIEIFPNPFSENFSINMKLEKSSKVNIDLFDINGRKVAAILQNQQISGTNKINHNFSDTNLASGIYILRFNIDGNVINKQIVKY
ncbi:MAG: M64 family metallopeptidase [Bacteroidales bacterium]|nr:M64 family metallopeptidase [Bacteroidales bacterium]